MDDLGYSLYTRLIHIVHTVTDIHSLIEMQLYNECIECTDV